jgi:SPP1 gp7 family putative phage head morphogenesis protein
MSAALRAELASAPIGEALERLLALQVGLITSLPTDAAERVQEASTAALLSSARYAERTPEVEAALERAHPNATEAWLRNRATLIARTETARSASVLVQARAEHIGAESYTWKTASDWKVRPSHRKLNNTVQRWDNPPLSDPPDYHAHPGQIFNCRCVSLPILPE